MAHKRARTAWRGASTTGDFLELSHQERRQLEAALRQSLMPDQPPKENGRAGAARSGSGTQRQRQRERELSEAAIAALSPPAKRVKATATGAHGAAGQDRDTLGGRGRGGASGRGAGRGRGGLGGVPSGRSLSGAPRVDEISSGDKVCCADKAFP